MLINKAYRKDFVLYKGSHFIYQVPLSDIYVPTISGSIISLSGGAKLKADVTKTFAITASLSSNNTILNLTVSSTISAAITTEGIYKFAIDITIDGVIYTILVGEITVEEDVSKIV